MADLITLGAAGATDGIFAIADERQRQITAEGWTAEHDDGHDAGELASAGAHYAMTPRDRSNVKFRSLRMEDNKLHSAIYPFDGGWYNPHKAETDARVASHTDVDRRIRELAKAGALIAAEIDRLVRLKGKANG